MLLPLRVLHPSEQPNVFNTSKLLWTERFLVFPSNDHERNENQDRILGLIKEKNKESKLVDSTRRKHTMRTKTGF